MITPRLLTLQDLFGDRVHYEVPIYQRPYVWDEEDQWAPLWEDIHETTLRHLSGESGAIAHFLGSIVIELTSAEPGHLKMYTVIDGQQRLTTLQLALAALRTVASDRQPDRVSDIQALLQNTGRHTDGPLKYKVWPSEHDQPAFEQALAGNGTSEANAGIPGAYVFFRDRISEFLDEHTASENGHFDALQDTLEGLMQLVSIQLDGTTEAQVVFETLNSRGADLTSLDLVKNSLLQQARRDGDDIAELYSHHWYPSLGDADYWLEEIRQGRYTSPRSDLFLMHWQTMKTGKPARVQRLFADFQRDIGRAEDSPGAAPLIIELSRDAGVYRSFEGFDESTVEGQFFRRLDLLDTTTVIPVALLLFRTRELADQRRQRALQALESWLVRRMICGSTAQHYNRLVAALLYRLNQQQSLADADTEIIDELRGFSSPSDLWPLDDEIRRRIEDLPAYYSINTRRIRLLLEACEHALAASNRTEQVPIPDKLTVEHAMPQGWRDHWDPPSSTTLSEEDAAIERDARVHRLGNLTLVTQPLNSALSNAAWNIKRVELRHRSRLLINQRLCDHEVWDDARIDARGKELAGYIISTWPGPTADAWTA